jgi:hypothetical protein
MTKYEHRQVASEAWPHQARIPLGFANPESGGDDTGCTFPASQ